jgi:hypothetical protein
MLAFQSLRGKSTLMKYFDLIQSEYLANIDSSIKTATAVLSTIAKML